MQQLEPERAMPLQLPLLMELLSTVLAVKEVCFKNSVRCVEKLLNSEFWAEDKWHRPSCACKTLNTSQQ